MSLANTLLEESKQGLPLSVQQVSTNKLNQKVYIESYGCQMNFSDSEIVASILIKNGFAITADIHQATVIFVNTCSIREKAEQTVRNRLKVYNAIKRKNPKVVIGILGCMAERLKKQLLEEEKLIDMVVGPDAYRELPLLLKEVEGGHQSINVLLSREETYADINPVRLNSNGVSAFVSIMRGCDNMCSYCVVPFTRGRERSRNPESILIEIKDLVGKGFKEVTLLGQNVDSYLFTSTEKEEVTFAKLLEMVAQLSPDLRVRFSTSHPKDMTDDVFHVMAKYENVCKAIHLPVQSGNFRILGLMNRGYTREWYLERIKAIQTIVPECSISTDIITGFCSETEQEHQDTLSLMDEVKYHFAYMFKYSERPNTPAHRKLKDDVADAIKTKRLEEVIATQQKHALERNKQYIGTTQRVLIEGVSKRSQQHWFGRNSQNVVVILPKGNKAMGDYIDVVITDCSSATLVGEI